MNLAEALSLPYKKDRYTYTTSTEVCPLMDTYYGEIESGNPEDWEIAKQQLTESKVLDIPGRYDTILRCDNPSRHEHVNILVDSVNKRCVLQILCDPRLAAMLKFLKAPSTYKPKPHMANRTLKETIKLYEASQNVTGHWIDSEMLAFLDYFIILNIPMPYNSDADLFDGYIKVALRKYQGISNEVVKFGWLLTLHQMQTPFDMLSDYFDIKKDTTEIFKYDDLKSFANIADADKPEDAYILIHEKRQLEHTIFCYPNPIKVHEESILLTKDEIKEEFNAILTHYMVSTPVNKGIWLCKFEIPGIANNLEDGNYDPYVWDQRLPQFSKAFSNGMHGLFQRISIYSISQDYFILGCEFPQDITPERLEKFNSDMTEYAMGIIDEFHKYGCHTEYRKNESSEKLAENRYNSLTTMAIMRLAMF